MGAIFRTAECAGLKKVFLTGYTPAPVDQFARQNKQISKTALGAEVSVEWEKRENIFEVIGELKKQKFKILALEQSEKSVDYRKVKLENNAALILGNEVGGIEAEILQHCDQIIEIEMKGEKESLNVSVAAGIALFRLLDL